jgi:hypothetical protein
MPYIENRRGAPQQIHDTGQWVEPDDTIEVDAALAGRSPKGTPGEEGYDPGEGLLAQPANWGPSTKKAFDETVKRQEKAAAPETDPDTTTADEETK